MTGYAPTSSINVESTIGDFAVSTRRASKRILPILGIVLGLCAGYEFVLGQPQAAAFALICAGSWASLAVWNSRGSGLPLVPVIAIQNLVVYGMPIAPWIKDPAQLPLQYLLEAGTEVLVFDAALAISWLVMVSQFRPSKPVCHALRRLNKGNMKAWSRLGFIVLLGVTIIELLQRSAIFGPYFDSLPSGTISVISAASAAAASCGLFLVSSSINMPDSKPLGRLAFWLLLAVNCVVTASDFLLYGAAARIFTVAIGFFWSRGRIPWFYICSASLILSFFNSGKTVMREHYWSKESGDVTQITLTELPTVYSEWVEASYDIVSGNPRRIESSESKPFTDKEAEGQSLLTRIDNLSNLLFVIDAVKGNHIPTLEGSTYSIIPKLLVPRAFWPDKPRTHEGQIMLNVHFGRQLEEDTESTYIAWGLLPEAYGNFGPLTGAICLGLFLGVTFAWLERISQSKLLLSTEGFIFLSLLISVINSFEMVASVLVTSIFQSIIVIVAASLPFVQRTIPKLRAGQPET